MADKSTAIPIGICENVPVMVANVKIPTHFVILEMPEDDNPSIILGRPFLNRDFYFHALRFLVILSFPPSPCLKPSEGARTGGFPFS
jgi:hypothetical protein